MSNGNEARMIYEGMQENYAELIDASENGVTTVPIRTAIRLADIGKAIALELVKERAKSDERAKLTSEISDAFDRMVARVGTAGRY
ncbi:hypothetical protein [Paenibacillus tundrae]|uniref:Uncharacterized protein n=1 Tax=Paenibacillus tundrae TaxID=528187 RepID=A0ABT9W642_9BACL|nr:hypothetical protein [Paenibacillus tundrae]MDQ0168700.1 hypothetical protein [Paenibacillus tundrae]